MKTWLALFLSLMAGVAGQTNLPAVESSTKKVFIVPIREDIMPPLVYLVRRGVKEAMAAKADLLVLDMETNGGRVDTTEKIIEILNQFKGETATLVNSKAFSAGAFISVATQKIFMTPGSVIGAAAPVILSPGGGGVESTPDTYEVKMTSAVSALVRASAEKNGHNKEVVQAMIDKSRGLTIDGEVIVKEGQILTLTNLEAEKEYDGKPLLSAGTADSMDALLTKLGYADAQRVEIKPTGVETLGFWINAISPLLLIIGIAGIYIEFKTPGFGLPGIIGITAFAIYFLGGYVAGLSGFEWIAVFVLGLILVALEIFVHPGTILPGLLGAMLMLVALVMAMVDIYPGMPSVPTLPQLKLPMQDLLIALVGSLVAVFVLSRVLPKTPVYRLLVSHSASGVGSVALQEQKQVARMGQVGATISPLRPGGKAQFGSEILDVISQGDMIAKGQPVKIIGHSGTEAIVEVMS